VYDFINLQIFLRSDSLKRNYNVSMKQAAAMQKTVRCGLKSETEINETTFLCLDMGLVTFGSFYYNNESV